MWRIFSLKSLICVIALSGLVIFILSKSTPDTRHKIKSGQSSELLQFFSKDEGSPHNGHNKPQQFVNYDAGKLQTKENILDYPFDDDAPPAAINDFDGFSAPGDEQINEKLKQKVGKGKGQKNKGNFNIAKHGKDSDVLHEITCDVNHGKYVIGCKKDQDNEVYVPFSFLQRYFEIYGKISETDPNKFIWLHSQVKIFRPKKPYDPKGVFTFFDNYNVEIRDRVKCISGPEGVPVSTQWDTHGYFYPIQIAQFGLSHYSKYVIEGEPSRVNLDNAEFRGNWIIPKGYPDVLKVIPDSKGGGNKLLLLRGGAQAPRLPISAKPRFLVLSWDMKTDSVDHDVDAYYHAPGNSLFNITLTVTARYESQLFNLHYTTGDFLIKVRGNDIYHGVGTKSKSAWHHIIRDIGVDLQKGIVQANNASPKKLHKISKSKIVLESLAVSCSSPCLFDNFTLAQNENLQQFYQAADWFVTNQDEKGGWSIPVRRKFGSDFYPVLEPGWYSSMAQGHAISLLARAYLRTKESKYANACSKALETIFDNSGEHNKGVKAVFLNQFVWYEEYPTNPSTFVLNGFMYSLLGLYDVRKLGVPGAAEKAGKLYEAGVHSLISMLPLYDTGSGTMYDLRHFTVPGISPNLARLDYHVTHINQLLTFATIHEDPIFSATAERWIRYTEGVRASHN